MSDITSLLAPEAGRNGRFLLTAWAVYTPVFLVTFLTLINRRNKQPIKARSALMLAINALAGYIMATGAVFQEARREDFSCLNTLGLLWVVYPAYFGSYVIRAWRLIKIFRLNVARSAYQALHAESGANASVLKAGHSRLTNTWLLIYLLIIMIPFLAWGTRNLITDDSGEWTSTNTDCVFTRQFHTFSSIYFGIYIALLMYGANLLRGVNDAFNMGSELIGVAAVLVVTMVPYLYVNLSLNSGLSPKDYNEDFSVGFLVMGWVVGTFLISVFWPVFRSFVTPPEIKFPGHVEVTDLKSVLKQPQLSAAFKQFCVSDFTPQNYVFYVDVEQYRTLSDASERVIRANALQEKFLIPNAILELEELPLDVRSKVDDGIGAPTEALFDEAQKWVYDHMEEDTFPRFKRSKEFRVVIAELSKEENIQHDLEDSGVL